MATFNSEEVVIARDPGFIYEFLADFGNFEKLMPPQVTDWKSDSESCSFNIQNMATLGMRFRSRIPNSRIDIVADGKVPFSFDLQCFIDESGPDTSRVKLQFNADLSPMLMMMASRPLSNFINILAVKLKEICEAAS